jgi:hypothetical protein
LPGWGWEAIFSRINRNKIVVLNGLSMKMRMLVRLVLRRATRTARITRAAGTRGFELMLAPSQEDPRRYAIESVKEIDRHTALKALRAFGLVGTTSLVRFKSLPGQKEQGEGGTGEASSAPRITFIRLTPRQALSMFGAIRRRDSNVRELYAHLKAKNLKPIRREVRGAVIRAYAADGTARGEGIVLELPHRKADGTEALFYVSIKDWMTGEGGVWSGEVRTDYDIRRGEQVDTYAIKDGRARLAKRVRTSRQTSPG